MQSENQDRLLGFKGASVERESSEQKRACTRLFGSSFTVLVAALGAAWRASTSCCPAGGRHVWQLTTCRLQGTVLCSARRHAQSSCGVRSLHSEIIGLIHGWVEEPAALFLGWVARGGAADGADGGAAVAGGR